MSDKETIEEKGFKITCEFCSVWFIVPRDWRERKIKDHTPFYCPNGHLQTYDRREVK